MTHISLESLREYILKSIPSVCLYHDLQRNSGDFIFILNLSCYVSMDSAQRALQTNGKMESFFKFRIFGRKLNFFLKE